MFLFACVSTDLVRSCFCLHPASETYRLKLIFGKRLSEIFILLFQIYLSLSLSLSLCLSFSSLSISLPLSLSLSLYLSVSLSLSLSVSLSLSLSLSLFLSLSFSSLSISLSLFSLYLSISLPLSLSLSLSDLFQNVLPSEWNKSRFSKFPIVSSTTSKKLNSKARAVSLEGKERERKRK